MNRTTIWRALAAISAALSAMAGRKAATALWSAISDTEGPVNPADRSVTWTEAVGWAVVAGLTAGLARVLGRRGAAAAWESVTGETPPGVQTA